MHLMDTSLVIADPNRTKKNKCPFCFHEFDRFGLAPHVNLVHKKSENFELIKQMTKIADLDWYQASMNSRKKRK
jgi:hypothetical protein